MLEVGREAVEILVVGQESDGLEFVEVVVPDSDGGEDSGKVLFQWSIAKMWGEQSASRSNVHNVSTCLSNPHKVLIHRVPSLEQLDKLVESNVNSNRQTDGRPQAVASADPVPKGKHVFDVDAEFGDFGRVGGEGDKVFRDRFGLIKERTLIQKPSNELNLKDCLTTTHVLCGLEEPSLGRVGVGDGLDRCKRLGGNNKQRRLRVEPLERLSHVRSVNVGNKVDIEPLLRVVLEGFGHHDGPKVGTADTNVDDVRDGLSRVSFPFTGPDTLADGFHLVQNLVDLGHHVLAVDQDRSVGAVPKSHVQDGAVFGKVDFFAGKHLGAVFFHAGFFEEGDEVGEDLLGDEVLGVIEQDGGRGRALGSERRVHFVEAFRVCCKQLVHVDFLALGVESRLELLPVGEVQRGGHS